MRELRQFGVYLFGLLFAVAVLSAGALYAGFEGIHYVPEPDVSAVKKGVEVASAESAERRDGPPVWIAPTPKYDYDPRLMIVKPREERLKDAELKRKQQAAKYMADQLAEKRARQKVAQQRHERRVREAGSAHAYQPEARPPAFGIFSIFR